jgi:glycosyltransferase involved in cell wall biosynthesis
VRALFLNQFYAPDIAATAQVLGALCRDLAHRGHDIAVLCGSTRYRQPHHGFQPSHEWDAASALSDDTAERRDGVQVHRIPVLSPPAAATGPAASRAGKLGRRLLQEARFSVGVFRRLGQLVQAQRPDVLIAMSTPPTLLVLALAVGLPRRLPVVFWVQDVYPDLLWATGLLRRDQRLHRALIAALQAGARLLYQRTTAAIVLDEAMRDRLLAAGFPADRLCVIDHAADSGALSAVPAEQNRVRRLLGLDPRDFVVCYAGNLGRGHDFATVAAALPGLASDPALCRVHFAFIGDGEARASLEAAIPPSLRPRVHFLPPQESALHREVLSVGDVALVTLGAGFAGLMTPSKIYPLLAASRPILYVGPATGRVAELTRASPGSHPVGERVENGDVPGFLAALRRLLDDLPRRQAMAQQARRLAEERFDQRLASDRHEALLTRLVDESLAPATPSSLAGSLLFRRGRQ